MKDKKPPVRPSVSDRPRYPERKIRRIEMGNPMDDDDDDVENRLTDRKRFPSVNCFSFPVEELVLRYTLNLLPHSPLCRAFLELIFDRTGLPNGASTVAEAFRPFIPEKERKKILGSGDIDDLVSSIIRTLGKKNAALHWRCGMGWRSF
jgi:hypothetical protein